MEDTENKNRRQYDILLIRDVAGEVMKTTEKEMRIMFKEELAIVLKEANAYTDAKFQSCKACEIFEDKENVKGFFSVTGDYKKTVLSKRDYQWIIALLATALLTVSMKFFKLF